MLRDLWAYRRRAVAIAAVVLAALLAVAVIVAATLGTEGRHRAATPSFSHTPPATSRTGATPHPSASGYDHGPWDAMPAAAPGTSAAFPPISKQDRTQPDLFVQAFGTELLTRDYRHATRNELLAWAASESAPLSIAQVPLTAADRAKALLVSLTSPAWDHTASTLVPTVSDWASLAAEDAHTTVSKVKVENVPDFPPADTTFSDPLTLDRLFTATVALHTKFAGKSITSTRSVAFEVVLGTSAHHGRVFGAAMTQHYVVKEYVP
jgi:hypothetical protein